MLDDPYTEGAEFHRDDPEVPPEVQALLRDMDRGRARRKELEYIGSQDAVLLTMFVAAISGLAALFRYPDGPNAVFWVSLAAVGITAFFRSEERKAFRREADAEAKLWEHGWRYHAATEEVRWDPEWAKGNHALLPRSVIKAEMRKRKPGSNRSQVLSQD